MALITNLSRENIPNEYISILKRNRIEIFEIPFDEFCFDKKYLWSLAFYKLCALNAICGMEYDNVCYMDADVYVQDCFDNIWKECDKHILLLDINHGFNVKDYTTLYDEVKRMYKTDVPITHFGGEFFAASRKNATIFLQECKIIYAEIQEKRFETKTGDEFIVSCAAERIKHKIKNGGAYINRFWTNPSFRLISTCYKFNRVAILHLPAEKEHGFPLFYQRYTKPGVIPNDRIVWKIFRLEHLTFVERIKVIIRNFQKLYM